MVRYRINGVEVSQKEFDEHACESRLQEMLLAGRPPLAQTDREFLMGHCNGNQFEKTPGVGDLYQKEARAAGVDPKGKIYLAGLAEYPGDPTAWVDGRGDVRKIVEERGWGCRGMVNVKPDNGRPQEETIDVADDLVAERVQDAIAENPELASRDQGELKHEVKQTMKPIWKKK